MRRWAVLALLLTLACSQRSEVKCRDLPFVKAADVAGSRLVCATSFVVTQSTSPRGVQCAEASTHAQAKKICTQKGMRLCTRDELFSDEAKGSGCDLENERVWSSSTQGCARKEAVSLAGSVFYLGSHPPECTPMPTPLFVRCCADEWFCESDECMSSVDSRNKCMLDGAGEYYCLCNAPGFLAPADERSCLPPPSPCERKSTCSNDLDSENVCVDNGDGTHACLCGGRRWIYPPSGGRASCVYVGDPCLGLPCNEQMDKGNRCLDRGDSYICTCNLANRFKPSKNLQTCDLILDPCRANSCDQLTVEGNTCIEDATMDGSYTCRCMAEGWRATSDGLACVEVVDTCNVNDPCNTQKDPANVCTFLADEGKRVCTCGGLRWASAQERTICAPIPDACAGNPCSGLENPSNLCIDRLDGTHVCQCFGERFALGPGALSCTYLPDPCRGNPCSSAEDRGNICQDKADGTYTCFCSGVRYRLGPGSQSCLAIPDPCRENPCRTNEDRSNICNDANDGTYLCTCGGVGWQDSTSRQGCILTPNACQGNLCQGSPDRQNFCTDRRDGTYFCTCGQDWTVTPDGTECLATPDQCRLKSAEDPCTTRASPRNICQDEGDGTYRCICGGDDWRTSDDLESCVEIPQPCRTAPCLSTIDPRNRCVDEGNGQHGCVCGGVGFRATADRRSCELRPDACLGDPCSSTARGNVCVDDQEGAFTCICSADGWTRAEDKMACIAPVNECDRTSLTFEDPCSTLGITGDPNNKCVDNGDTSFYCLCKGDGWKTPFGATFCLAPARPCEEGDPCSRAKNPQNDCDDNGDGTYECTCSNGWKAMANNQLCIPPKNPCSGVDPCSHLKEEENLCVDLRDGSYECECAAGWRSTDNFDHCLPPKNPCLDPLNPDPCSSVPPDGHPGNICIDNRDGTYECKCGGAGWRTPFAPNACLEPFDPCEEDIKGLGRGNENCEIFQSDGLNLCVNDGNQRYHCICKERGWIPTGDEQRCEEMEDACIRFEADDPCGTELSDERRTRTRNDCQSFPGGTYRCTCREPGWKLSRGGKRCIAPPRLCIEANDPCSTMIDRSNRCQDNLDGTYVCDCLGRGWRNTGDRLSCRPPKNFCLVNIDDVEDPCRTREHPLNFCIDERDGTYRCECNAPGHTVDVLLRESGQRCVCPDPCTVGDPCAITESPDNSCEREEDPDNEFAGPNRCGWPRCTCDSEFFKKVKTPWGSERCAPVNPCETNDPCLHRHHSSNICLTSYRGASAYWEPETDPLNPARNGQTVVSDVPVISVPTVGRFNGLNPVAGAGFSNPNTVLPFPGPATNIGPLGNRFGVGTGAGAVFSPFTPFRRTHNERDGGLGELFFEPAAYFCQCGAPGWITPLGAQRCEPPNPCLLGDPCNHRGSRGNICHAGRKDSSPYYEAPLGGDGLADYHCTCDGPGWFGTPGNHACERCPNPCLILGDPCATLLSDANRCIWEHEDSIFVDPRDISGLPSGRRLFAHNPFGGSGSLLDENELAQCGGYTCECNAKSFTAPFGAQSCLRCNDPCVQDPCRNGIDTGNTCRHIIPDLNAVNPNSDEDDIFNFDSFDDVFNQGQPQLPNNNQNSQPVVTQQDLLRLQNDVCGWFECTCNEPEWVTPLGRLSCERCINPCDLSPCASNLDGNNVCVFPRVTPLPGTSTASPTVAPFGRRLFGTLDNQESSNNAFNNLAGFGESCGPYECQCGGVGFVEALDETQCVRCIDPCEAVGEEDPCRVAQHPLNKCVMLPRRLPTGTVEGPQAAGRRLLDEDEEEEFATEPSTFDEVRRRQFSGRPAASRGFASFGFVGRGRNRASFGNGVLGLRSISTPLDPTAGFVEPALPVCGDYQCVCNGLSWVESATNRKCTKICTNRCTTDDPCRTSADIRNRCSFSPPTLYEECGFHTCTCAPGWVQGFGDQTCDPPGSAAVACLGQDNCKSRNNPGNFCTENDGDYFCTCRARGWIIAVDGFSCIRAVTEGMNSTCRGHDWCQTVNFGNICSEPVDAGKYVCVCQAAGYKSSLDKLACVTDLLAPASCVGHDNCQVTGHIGNLCQERVNSYECQCDALGFEMTTNGLGCGPKSTVLRPQNCDGHDNCKTLDSTQNSCFLVRDTTNAALTYECGCSATDNFEVTVDRLFCRDKSDPWPTTCRGHDHCRTGAFRGNGCTERVGEYLCSCNEPGFLQDIDRRRCLEDNCAQAGVINCVTTAGNACADEVSGYSCICNGLFQPSRDNSFCLT